MRRLARFGLLAALVWVACATDREEPAEAETPATPDAAEAAETPAGAPQEAGCMRKGRRWPEGSRVCEDHRVTRCFSDGEWHVIGSC